MEGYLFGIPAIAFSQVDKGWGELEAAAQKAADMVRQMLALEARGPVTLVAQREHSQPALQVLRGIVVPPGAAPCRRARHHQVSPRGETMYWIGGAGAALDDSEGTDFMPRRWGMSR